VTVTTHSQVTEAIIIMVELTLRCQYKLLVLICRCQQYIFTEGD